MERAHGTFRQRDKVIKGFKDNKKQFAQNFQIHYNFIKNIMTLKVVLTQKTGIKRKPEWKGLLLKALQ